MSDHSSDHSTPTAGGIGGIAKWVFIGLGVIVFFSLIVPGCIKGCKNTSDTPARARKGSSSSSWFTQKPIQEATFTIFEKDSRGKTTNVYKKTTQNGTWKGPLPDYGNIVPDPGSTIVVIMPGHYNSKNVWMDPPKPKILRGGQPNPPLVLPEENPRGRGDVIIKVVVE